MPHDVYLQRLEDLHRAEYGSRGETVIRYLIMGSVVGVLLFVLDRTLVMIWGGMYFLLEISVAAAVHMRGLVSTQTRYLVALSLYGLSGLCFMSLPLYLISANISPGMTFAGGAGLVGLLLYTLQRPQREPGLMVADCAQVLIITAALLIILHPKLDTWMDQITVVFIALCVAGYYVGSLTVGWRQQRRLRDAQQRYATAQKARAMGQFVGGVAHDFNNQLTAVLGNLELHEQLTNPQDRAAALSECRAAAERAAMTVQQLLASSGRTRLAPTPLAMGDFLFDLGEVLTDLLDPEMTVELVPLPDPLVAYVDQDMLETSAIQLCLNAQDATKGRGRIALSVEQRSAMSGQAPHPDAPHSFVALIIEDNGPGVPVDALPMIAEPFYTTKPASEGRGLGASAVAGFARQSGGDLLFETSPMGGLRAVVLLPQATGD